MRDVTAADILEALSRLPLVSPAQVAEVERGLRGRGDDARELLRELVRRGWLTPFQANRLVTGQGQGLVLGPYVLLDLLGEGGAGQVFKARHRVMDRVVALKVIRAGHLDSAGSLQRFLREVRILAQLSHPNVVHVHDVGEAGGVLFLAMEYVEGADLAKLVQERGPLPTAEACEYVRQAALGLQHAHERGMVHRDVKPQNLLRTPEGAVKVLDFGLVRALAAGRRDSAGLTRAGAVLGTPAYMAPELVLGERGADVRADVYSLGCTLYELLAGQPPFEGTATQVLYLHATGEPRPLHEVRPEVPRGLSAVVARMLAKGPGERYQSPAEVAQALAHFCRPGADTLGTRRPSAPEATPLAGPVPPQPGLARSAERPSAPQVPPAPRRGGLWRAWGLLLRSCVPSWMRPSAAGPAPTEAGASPLQAPGPAPPPEEEGVGGLALAQLEGPPDRGPLLLRAEYKLRAGVRGGPRPRGGAGPTAFDVAVRAPDMDVLPDWRQQVTAGPQQDRLAEFTLVPRRPGRKRIEIDYYHRRHWLAHLDLEVEVVAT